MFCVGLGCLSRATIDPADTDGCTGVKATICPRTAVGGCCILVLNVADRDTLVPMYLPVPIFLALVLISVGFVLSPVLACENSLVGARWIWSRFMADSRGACVGAGEVGLAGELVYILGWVIVARSFPETVVFTWTFVENGVCTGATVVLSVIIKGLGTMGINPKCFVRSGFIGVVWACAALAHTVTPPEQAVLPAAESLRSCPAGSTEKADGVLGTN